MEMFQDRFSYSLDLALVQLVMWTFKVARVAAEKVDL
jgi:hypothetical protein